MNLKSVSPICSTDSSNQAPPLGDATDAATDAHHHPAMAACGIADLELPTSSFTADAPVCTNSPAELIKEQPLVAGALDHTKSEHGATCGVHASHQAQLDLEVTVVVAGAHQMPAVVAVETNMADAVTLSCRAAAAADGGRKPAIDCGRSLLGTEPQHTAIQAPVLDSATIALADRQAAAPAEPREETSDKAFTAGDHVAVAGESETSALSTSETANGSTTSEVRQGTDGQPMSTEEPSSAAPKTDAVTSEVEPDSALREKHLKKASLVAQEILTTEEEYCDNLKLLDQDFRGFILSPARSHRGHFVSSTASKLLSKILRHLHELHSFSETLVTELAGRVKNWCSSPKLADIFVRIGPFLKLFTSYITDFEESTAALDEAVRHCRGFAKRLEEFEATERCRHLRVRHFMLKPIQRIPQYELLLKDYQRWLLPDSPDVRDVRDALAIVSEAASHANEAMKHAGRLQALLNIQSMLVGDFRVIEPSRELVKSGQIWKHSRKEIQERMLILFSDLLLIASPLTGGRYRKKYTLSLHGMRTSRPDQEIYQKEFTIVSKQKSFTMVARSQAECEAWCSMINKAIEEREAKLKTFSSPVAGERGSNVAVAAVAPVWVPDSRTSMCMLCCARFTPLRRRHHCRACGKVVCGSCSNFRAPLKYAADEPMRVCSLCYIALLADHMRAMSASEQADDIKLKSKLYASFRGPSRLAASVEPVSGKSVKRSLTISAVPRAKQRPAVLREVAASETGVMNSYLQTCTEKRPKWKQFWFVLKGGVLYKFMAIEDTAAVESTPLLGYEVTTFAQPHMSVTNPGLLFKLSKPDANMIEPVLFQADTEDLATRWVTAMKEFTLHPAYVDSRKASRLKVSNELEKVAAS